MKLHERAGKVIHYNLIPINSKNQFFDVLNKLDSYTNKNALMDCYVKFFKVDLMTIDCQETINIVIEKYNALKTMYNQVKKYSFTEKDKIILNTNIKRIEGKYLTKDHILMLSNYKNDNNTLLSKFLEIEKYINCLNNIISKCSALIRKYSNESFLYFCNKYPELFTDDNMTCDHIKYDITNGYFKSMFQHLQNVNIDCIDCNDIPHSENIDNINKIVKVINEVPKVKFYDIKQIFNIVNEMNI